MYPEDLKYNPEHTWLRLDGSGSGLVGITDFAQRQLKDVVFVELPEKGTSVVQMESFGVVESVKATNDLYSPVSGVVTDVNQALIDDPSLVNKDPYGAGWMVKVELSKPTEVESLLSAESYKAAIGE
jgi:glycine cleavage system H protein